MSNTIDYEIVDGYDHIFDEKGNTFLSLRKISWGGREPKLDLRKWYTMADGEERVGRGVGFLTEEGPHELTRILVQEGFGYTNELMDILSTREDFNHEKYDLDSLATKDNYINPETLFEDIDTEEE